MLDSWPRMPSIVCTLFPSLDQTSFQRLDAQGRQPNRRGLRGKLPCMCRIRCRNPSQPPRLFHVCQALREVQQDPKPRDRCVPLQLAFSFESLSLWANFHPLVEELTSFAIFKFIKKVFTMQLYILDLDDSILFSKWDEACYTGREITILQRGV